jgi:DNA-3-methyladenine glycosylase
MPTAASLLGLPVLPASWYERDAPDVAADLLGKILMSGGGPDDLVAGRIVEVEAYAEHDPASHTYVGPTPRNAAMYGPPGHLYVYLSYGLHHCANVVTGRSGNGQAVLLRAVQPLFGVERIRQRRGGRPDRDLTDGPGKLGQAFGIDLGHYGTDITDRSAPIRIADDGTPPPAAPIIGPRVGVSKAIDVPWRFRVPDRRDR